MSINKNFREFYSLLLYVSIEMILGEKVSLNFDFALNMSFNVLQVYATFNFTVLDYEMAALKSQEQGLY